jgi:hypothetical protein
MTLIDWTTFWQRDTSQAEWLIDDIIAVRRAHTIWATRKAGKSLVTLWLALELIRQGHVVVYLDWEMTEDDLFDRLDAMGCGPETDLSRLRYDLLPTLPPLNTEPGALAVIGLVDEAMAAHPERHVVLIIDTFSRAVVGEENSNDVPRQFYAQTGLRLKQKGVTYIRLDHAGHDASHERGASSKGDDIDLSWKLLARDDGGFLLERHLTRIPWAPATVALKRLEEPLRFEVTNETYPQGTMDCAADLTQLGLPLDISVRTAAKALRDADMRRRTNVIAAALKYRRSVSRSRALDAERTARIHPPETGGENRSTIEGKQPGKQPETQQPGQWETVGVPVGDTPSPPHAAGGAS